MSLLFGDDFDNLQVKYNPIIADDVIIPTLLNRSITHRTRKAKVHLKESFLTGVAMAIVCARPLLSWQCPKGHFLDFRLSPTAHGRFIRSGLPPGSRYLLTPNRRLLTLREVFQSEFTVSALSIGIPSKKSFRTTCCCKDSFGCLCKSRHKSSGSMKNLHTCG